MLLQPTAHDTRAFWCDFCKNYHETINCPHPSRNALDNALDELADVRGELDSLREEYGDLEQENQKLESQLDTLEDRINSLLDEHRDPCPLLTALQSLADNGGIA